MVGVMTLSIDAKFDSGNIEVLDASSPSKVRLAIRPDVGDEHYQWFHFRVGGGKGTALRLVITNAKGASYEGGWPDYRACASYDREHWFRVPTSYEEGELVIAHTPEHDFVWYAYFAPYSHERHQALIGRMQSRPGVHAESLGQTLDGHSLDLLTVGQGETPVWIIARQHPGESMAEWLVEGMLERLLDPDDALARTLLAQLRFHVVPNMNPDGAVRGHLRTNAAGANLNREWESPSMERSPEVFLTRARMDRTGLRFCLDVHGDEALPYNFIAGSDGVADLHEEVLRLRDVYCAALERSCPDFQNEHGYPRSAKGKANLTMATNQLAERFQALSMTLEMPFKDNARAPRLDVGWSPGRCKCLGHAQLDALAAVAARL